MTTNRSQYSLPPLWLVLWYMLMSVLAGCGDARRVVREVPRTLGVASARIVELSPAGGATVGFGYAVEVGVRLRNTQAVSHWAKVFDSYRVEPLDVVWGEGDTLFIKVDAAEYNEYSWSVRLKSRPRARPILRIVEVPQ